MASEGQGNLIGIAEDKQDLLPDFHKGQALLLPGHPPARLPLLDQVLDLHEQRNGAGALAPPEERRHDGSTRSSKPLHIGINFEGHQVHIQVLKQVQAKS